MYFHAGFLGGSDSKESTCNVGRPGFNPWVGLVPWRRDCLENPRDRGACWATVHGVEASGTRLSD